MGSIVAENRKSLMLFSGRGFPELALEIGEVLGIAPTPSDAYDFANGEIFVRYRESVRGSDAFVVQSVTTGVNKWVMETLIMVDALKRGSAKRITVVLPYYPYARQDKKHRGREPISARLVADLLKQAGANRILTVDLHTAQIQGFFDGPVDHLFAMDTLAGYVEQRYAGRPMTVVAPDSGRVRVAERWTDRLGGCPLAFIHKTRDPLKPNQVVANRVVGDVEGRVCLIVDDMIDTGSTICKAAEILRQFGRGRRHRGVDARAAVRPRHRAAQEQPDQRGGGDQHAAAAAREAPRQDHGALDRPAARPRHPRSLRRRLRHHPLRRFVEFLSRPARPNCLRGRLRAPWVSVLPVAGSGDACQRTPDRVYARPDRVCAESTSAASIRRRDRGWGCVGGPGSAPPGCPIGWASRWVPRRGRSPALRTARRKRPAGVGGRLGGSGRSASVSGEASWPDWLAGGGLVVYPRAWQGEPPGPSPVRAGANGRAPDGRA